MKSICLVKEILFHSFDFFMEAREFILKKNPRWLSLDRLGNRLETPVVKKDLIFIL